MTRRIPVVVAVGLLAATNAGAQETTTTLAPAISVSTAHDDNVFSTPQGVTDIVTTIQPSLESQLRSPTVNLQSLVSFDMQQSARHTLPTTLAARRHAMFDGRVRTSPSVLLGLTGLYDRTETASDLSLNAGLLLPLQPAQILQTTPSVAFRVTPVLTITGHYDWTHQALIGSPASDLHIADLGVARQSSSRTTWSAGYIERRFVDDVAVFRSHASVLGWARELRAGTKLSLQAGPRITSSRVVTPEVRAAFIRQTPGTHVLVDYWRGDTMVLGIHGPVEVQRGTTSLTWTAHRRLNLGTTLGVFRSAALDAPATTLYHAALVSTWRHEPYLITVSYSTDLQRGSIALGGSAGEQVRRNVLLVRLTVAPRLSRAFRPPDDADQPARLATGVIP
ncbi:MAG TPA: hypothetical protein VFO58_17355 [Vicinamibacterales bacterium]|nr:hypothetical protein [Vicinamibacterales bacterium]